jgi:hypothetical protein
MTDKLVSRKLTLDEQSKIDTGLQRWYIVPFVSNNISLYEMLVNPYKYIFIWIIIICIFWFLYYKFIFFINKKSKGARDIKLWTSIHVIISIIFIFLLFIYSNKQNTDIILLIPHLSDNPTYGDFKKNKHLLKKLNTNYNWIIQIASLFENSNNRRWRGK